MTTITLELPDQVVRVIEQRALLRGVTVNQQISELLEESTAGEQGTTRTEAIRRMDELFAQVRGFQVEPRIPREELYERGSLH